MDSIYRAPDATLTTFEAHMIDKDRKTGDGPYTIQHRDLLFLLASLEHIGLRWIGCCSVLTTRHVLCIETCISGMHVLLSIKLAYEPFTEAYAWLLNPTIYSCGDR